MNTAPKASPGDLIRFGNGHTHKIIHIMPAAFTDGFEYELGNGMIMLDYEFTREDVEAQA